MMPDPVAAEERLPADDVGRALLGPRVAAGALVALGALLIVSALGIARGGGYQLIGPATFPLATAIGLLVLSAIFVVRTTLKPDRALAEHTIDEERATYWPTVGLVMVALVVYALTLDGFEVAGIDVPGLGYIAATGIFLPVAARILGSRQPIRDVILGFVLAAVIYFSFTEVLGVRLPAGLLGVIL
jgi:putative tricarboxylic transport membrane protein